MRLLTKKELEEIALSEIVDGPQWNVSGSRVFEIRREWMKWAAEEAAQIAKANTMGELEVAMNNPAVTEIFLPEHAAITSASLVQLLERSPLAKNIYAAFEIRL